MPGDDGMVPGPLRPHGPVRGIHDPLQLRHLHCPLPGDRRAGIHDEDLHSPAADCDVRHPRGGRVQPLSPAVRSAAPDPPGALVRVRGTAESLMPDTR